MLTHNTDRRDARSLVLSRIVDNVFEYKRLTKAARHQYRLPLPNTFVFIIIFQRQQSHRYKFCLLRCRTLSTEHSSTIAPAHRFMHKIPSTAQNIFVQTGIWSLTFFHNVMKVRC